MKALVLYPKYGLANRLRAIASAKILADYTGRKLFVNWIPSGDCNIEWEGLFVNKLERYPFPLSSFKAGINLYDDTNKVFNEFYWGMPQSLIGNTSDVIAVSACCNFQPKEMTDEEYTAFKSLFYRSLQPLDGIQRTVSYVYKRYFEGHEVVGVHIRRTDHLHYMNKDPRLVSPTALFIKAMNNILENNHETKFFLATDDKDEEKTIRHQFPAAVIVNEKETVSRNTKKGMQDALIDWLLLSKTSKIIHSATSSFSVEAAVVNMTKGESILRKEELSRTHYRMLFREYITTHYKILKNEGFRTYLSYSYNYRKWQVLSWIRKKVHA